MREADPIPELWDWTARAGNANWPGPARADPDLRRPPQPTVDLEAERTGWEVTNTMINTVCPSAPPGGYTRNTPLVME
eukprot:5065685-Alexandrium_andersonii.AAC.1